MSVCVVLKGWPRLSETFIAQELVGLERRGLKLNLFSLRHPTDKATHALHAQLKAPVTYLPEYLHDEPMRVARALKAARRLPGWSRARTVWLKDLARDRTRNRVRRFGQAMVLAAELPPDTEWIYAHFLHTPSSVARYAALMTGLPWSFSAHAKDIWTIPEWEKREKLADARWGVTCTRMGHAHLAGLAPVPERMELLYHGLEFGRFPPEPASRPPRTGTDPADPVILLSVGRAVEKKGFDVALAALGPAAAGPVVALGPYRRRDRPEGAEGRGRTARAERPHRLAGRPAAGCRDRQPHQPPTCSSCPAAWPATATATACPMC